MKRLGKFSGTVYAESEVEYMNEGGVCISDEEANDMDFISKHHVGDLMDCINCFACPKSQFGRNNVR